MKKKKSNVKKIAELAGVSTATVSRVFGRHPYVRPEVREKVLKIARELEYAPDSFRPRETYALIMQGGDYLQFNAYNSPFVFGFSSYLFEHDLSMEIMSAKNLEYLHRSSFKYLIDLSGDTGDVVSSLRKLELPALLVNKEADGFPSISTDHKSGMIQAIDHLVENGHHDIGLLSLGKSSKGWAKEERYSGFLEGLAKHSIPFKEEFCEFYEERNYIEPLARLLHAGATAIIYSHEVRLPRFHNALEVLGKRVPEDVSIIVYEDPETAPFFSPGYTAIDQQLAKIGQMAAERAIQLANGVELEKRQLRLPNILIARKSVKKL